MTSRFLLAILAITIISTGAAWKPKGATLHSMPVAGATSQPIGHFEFCKRYKKECQPIAADRARLKLTEELWNSLVEVNQVVNTIPAIEDIEIYGVEEFWNYPTTAADCEDFVLLKRKLLMRRGISASNLLITVVLQPDGSGHAVLTVRSQMGDFILDNLRAEIRNWSETEYTYLKRQDSRNPGKWVKIKDGRDTTAVSGIR
ncbi:MULTISPECIES: transglutaminase-like cysteine peptidase [Rhizobium/Agrobacterium group]|jgi:predicted transglutaminase-like cysteine proteinase|uniref:Transglutaminase n=2 Tax=Rhizobium rosettiformans TaxID=1368430 RepID=A0A4S8PT54_9HYPH|nr:MULTISPECIES: transglutaminase-like cysteine peptidase [Rhizobium/Agrobacterium group]MBB5277190.1 putative transglutaminase-like cysteine proteinase [Rhizobium rosettiformans]MDR7031136.1 putative transglutaminase-like cysteine proteinase [Rhizobium rosettiformans]MDR7067041.1 putative transglutaminase-like cysteine proteinase [Rhizobium rosettiformans]RSC29931.1 transglutaminase [Agrobacterium sp. FDAARGOS_525]THV34570.1 transglutaminase [Rhizobium rosettiformans W3]